MPKASETLDGRDGILPSGGDIDNDAVLTVTGVSTLLN